MRMGGGGGQELGREVYMLNPWLTMFPALILSKISIHIHNKFEQAIQDGTFSQRPQVTGQPPSSHTSQPSRDRIIPAMATRIPRITPSPSYGFNLPGIVAGPGYRYPRSIQT